MQKEERVIKPQYALLSPWATEMPYVSKQKTASIGSEMPDTGVWRVEPAFDKEPRATSRSSDSSPILFLPPAWVFDFVHRVFSLSVELP